MVLDPPDQFGPDGGDKKNAHGHGADGDATRTIR
jgi:hypothetical protein